MPHCSLFITTQMWPTVLPLWVILFTYGASTLDSPMCWFSSHGPTKKLLLRTWIKALDWLEWQRLEAISMISKFFSLRALRLAPWDYNKDMQVKTLLQWHLEIPTDPLQRQHLGSRCPVQQYNGWGLALNSCCKKPQMTRWSDVQSITQVTRWPQKKHFQWSSRFTTCSVSWL